MGGIGLSVYGAQSVRKGCREPATKARGETGRHIGAQSGARQARNDGPRAARQHGRTERQGGRKAREALHNEEASASR